MLFWIYDEGSLQGAQTNWLFYKLLHNLEMYFQEING